MVGVSARVPTPDHTPASPARQAAEPRLLYSERQWVPWYWWVAVAGLDVLLAGQLALNRNVWWFIVPLVVVGALLVWFLVWLSRTTVSVEQDADGTRWLLAEDAVSYTHLRAHET